MPPPVIMSKQALQQRLLLMIGPRGRKKPDDSRTYTHDVAAFLGIRREVLFKVAHKRHEIDDSMQLQLSSFFVLYESGRIVKVVEGEIRTLRRVPAPDGVPEPPRATIDLSGFTPRINWSRSWP